MSRSYLANVVLALLITLTTWALWSVGEHRVDVYIAMFVLTYVVTKAILRPRRRGLDVLLLILIATFFVIVSIRVYQVLTKP